MSDERGLPRAWQIFVSIVGALAAIIAIAIGGDQLNFWQVLPRDNGTSSSAPASPPSRSLGSVVLGSTEHLPDWLLVARQRDCAPGEGCPRGDVHFNQRTITRNADGTADIWIQVRHGLPQLYQLESETTETTIRFELERLHYRFNCTTAEFIVVERQIMGAGETVVARDEPRPIYRAPVRGSATAIIQPIACRGS